MKKFDDLELQHELHPILQELEIQMINAKPVNTLQFIKRWAKNKLKESLDSDQQNKQSKIDQEYADGNKNKQKSKNKWNFKRRNAILMTRIEPSASQTGLIDMKQPLVKNEECKSRIMLSLRQIPFLAKLSWEDIHNLISISQVKELYREEIFIKKDELILFLYIVIEGQVIKKDNKGIKKYTQGDSIMENAIISLARSPSNYEVVSEKAWICTIYAHDIKQMVVKANERSALFYEKVIMNISFFSILNFQQIYKLLCMIKQEKNIQRDQVIVKKYAPIQRLFIVVSGQFQKCKQSLTGEIVGFQTMRQGQYFGEEWLTQNSPESQYLIVSKSEGVLATIEKDDIERGICKISQLIERKKVLKRRLQNKK